MKRFMIGAIAATAAIAATPALAEGRDRDRIPAASTAAEAWVYSDHNSHYLDYKTSISEAERELAKDLAAADDESDRMEVRAEYERELADADYDFRKEMAERGIRVPQGRAILESEVAAAY